MKKLAIFLFTLVVVTASVNAQSKLPPSPPVLTAKDSLLARVWKLKSSEEFAVVSPVTEKQKNDGLTLMIDGTAFLTMEGVSKAGSWVTDKAKNYVNITIDTTAEKFKFKIISLSKEEFVYEYQDPELSKIKYTCVAKKK